MASEANIEETEEWEFTEVGNLSCEQFYKCVIVNLILPPCIAIIMRTSLKSHLVKPFFSVKSKSFPGDKRKEELHERKGNEAFVSCMPDF